MMRSKVNTYGIVLGAALLLAACGGSEPQQTASAPPDPAPINDLRNRYQLRRLMQRHGLMRGPPPPAPRAASKREP